MARGRCRGAVVVAGAVDDRDVGGLGEVEGLTQTARLPGKDNRVAGAASVAPLAAFCLRAYIEQRCSLSGAYKLHG
jgi:hypothetical protein